MKKIMLLTALLLGGCSTLAALDSATLTTTQVYAAANAFDAAEQTATQYLSLPPCGGSAVICRSPSAAAAVVAAGRGGISARRALISACIASVASTACTSAYTTVTTAISGLQTVFTQYAITKGN